MKLRIADICVAVEPINNRIELAADGEYKAFTSSCKPELVIKLHYNHTSNIPLKQKLFGVPRVWALYSCDGQTFIRCPDPTRNLNRTSLPLRLLSLSSDFKKGHLYFKSANSRQKKIFPLRHPLSQVLYTILVSLNQGILVHASGIIYKGKGFLFVGKSDAGKTTMAKLWRKVKGTQVLSDERVALRRIGRYYRIYGTPWLGQARIFSNASAPLEKIFFLSHAEKNTIKKIPQINTISALCARSRLPHWDRAGLSASLEFIEDLSKEVPCFNLGFYPDKNVIDFVLKS